MPLDDAESLASLVPDSVAAIVAAQEALDAPASAEEERSGTRFHLTSIPAAELRIAFGLSVSRKHGFLVTRRATSALRHVLSVGVRAVPEAIPPAPAGGWATAPFTVFEPAFMVAPEREIDLGLAICDALSNNACTVKVPGKVDAATVIKAGSTLRQQLVRPEHPELGVVAFRVSARPLVDLVVVVTEKAERDGIFLFESGQPPVLYSIPEDRNPAMFYEPLHRLTVAIGEWLSDQTGRRRTGLRRLPQEWGFTSLELLAESLVAGYTRSLALLAESKASGPLTQQFDLTAVRAEIAFGLRQRAAPSVVVAQEDDLSDALVSGQVLLEVERLRTAIGVTLTLVAPGYVLAPRAKDAFVARAQRVARDIAHAFHDDSSVDYVQAITHPSRRAEIVVLLSAEDADDAFDYLVTWPVNTTDGERHFVFRCREDRDSLDDIDAIVRASDRLGTISIPNEPDLSVDDDVYEAYSRFFRAARIWRSGVAHDIQTARLQTS
jgi:hypothetical protein